MEKLKNILAILFLAASIALWPTVILWCGWYNRYHNTPSRFVPKFSTYCLRVLHLN